MTNGTPLNKRIRKPEKELHKLATHYLTDMVEDKRANIEDIHLILIIMITNNVMNQAHGDKVIASQILADIYRSLMHMVDQGCTQYGAFMKMKEIRQ